MLAQAIHAFLAGEADGADGESQFGSDFTVGARGSFEEKKFHKATALRREGGHGVAQHLFFLRLLDKRFRDGGRFRYGQVGVRIAAYEALLLLFPAVALVMSDLHEPLWKCARFAK